MNLVEAFMRHVHVAAGGCWDWLEPLTDEGYGRLFWPPGNQITKRMAHTVSYELFKGPIPAGMEPDHLCRQRCCVNPEHLEAVTHKVNVHRGIGPTAINAAKTTCPNGHPLSGENLVPWAKNGRECRTCHKSYMRAYMRNRRRKVAS